MGRHLHSNSKALWETEPLGGGATHAWDFCSHGNSRVCGGGEGATKFRKGPLSGDNV